MTHPLSIILSVTPVQRGIFDRSKGTLPNVAVVYSTGSGQVAYFDGRPLTWSEQAFSQYRTRYDVDLSEHRRTAELRSTPLPSRGDFYFFIATVDVTFRVSDPAEVVRRNIRDPLPVVYGHLANKFRVITRGFDIEESTQAEIALRNAFDGEVALPQGITLTEVLPRLLPDEAANRYLRQKAEAGRSLQTNHAQHAVNVQQALQQGELDRMLQLGRIQAAQAEMAALGGGGEMSARQMVMLHLARNPHDTENALNLLMAHEQAMLERQDGQSAQTAELFRFLVENNLLQAGDVESHLPSLMHQMGLAAPPAAVQSTAWTQPPLLSRADPPAAVGPAGQPAKPEPAVVYEQDPVTKVWQPSDGVQPVYLMVDESAGVGPYISDLSNGVHALHDKLLRAADVSPAIRLSVLGFADQLATRTRLEAVVSGSESPWFAARGPADYARAFEMLLDQITPDIEELKQQQQKVLRPVVYLLSGSDPGDDTTWASPHRRLIDPAAHRYAPHIVATGFGSASARLISTLATQPELGYVMTPDTDVHQAIRQYWESLAQTILDSGRALIAGRPDLELAPRPPSGFRLARELV
ncbi:hypothetical protein GCM10010435_96210 [Winogradskya consettensis]|uniref:VWFA domain-containing protein n=1 Tax=Winogradskya consettensis TaxID=113560 RepID=A0A919SXP5_9ACTN|nr:hypothetical protein [Actinoplanes consettensis]GIM79311.1 hypothetical protein Aco04nite_64840 [Actinoplanes consettensis]